MEKTVLLAGAFLACQVYSAGTCSVIVAMVGLQLGLGEGEVRSAGQQAYQELKTDIDRRGVSIPNPTGGPPIVLRPRDVADVAEANRRFSALSPSDRRNPCKVIDVYRQIPAVAPFLAGLANPLSFRSPDQKSNALRIARQIDPGLAAVLDRVPVQGEGLSCG